PDEVVGPVPVASPDFEDVAKALRPEQPDDGARPGEERVEPHRGAVEEVAGRAELRLRDGRRDGGDHAFLGGRRRRGDLADADLAGLVVVADQIGEGAAYVDADPRRHSSTSVTDPRL